MHVFVTFYCNAVYCDRCEIFEVILHTTHSNLWMENYNLFTDIKVDSEHCKKKFKTECEEKIT